MEKIEIKDEDGGVTHIKRFKGKSFSPMAPDDFESHLRLVNTANYTEKDVFVVAYPKSGMNWTFEIVNMILRNSSEYFPNIPPFLDMATPSMLQSVFGNADKPGLIANHYQPQFFPQAAIKQKVRIVFVYRNPKDVAVSQYQFYWKLKGFGEYKNVSFKNYLKRYLDGNVPCGDWYSFHKEWLDLKADNQDYPILILCYEDMKVNLAENVRKIADFLEMNLEESTLLEIARKCEFRTMFQHKNSNLPPEMHMATEIKEHIFYRKGEVGDWKNWFTVAQDEEFDRHMDPLLDKIDINIRYSL
ncbi:hypothetical protein FSP39_000770 [Pinctada imbricata]|uniref:Sulfotransferase domain-containing protein n=1 Tax=Pinctada imbricata TaxID=66713 RepID=A0AA88YK04_PINIB|nr:hypothetical protein FSP39_000770 [Pinctada imbricata]